RIVARVSCHSPHHLNELLRGITGAKNTLHIVAEAAVPKFSNHKVLLFLSAWTTRPPVDVCQLMREFVVRCLAKTQIQFGRTAGSDLGSSDPVRNHVARGPNHDFVVPGREMSTWESVSAFCIGYNSREHRRLLPLRNHNYPFHLALGG